MEALALQERQIFSGKVAQKNFVCLLEANARRFGSRVALLWDGGEMTWAELDQKASGFARCLAAQGRVPETGSPPRDVATLSADGFVRIMGRKRERILRGGYSVFPQEVERVLLSHPAVAEAAVVGIPSPDLNEEVAAFVVLRPKAHASAEELSDFCEGRLARYKFPRRLTILEELPKGVTGKILKSELIRRQCSTETSESGDKQKSSG